MTTKKYYNLAKKKLFRITRSLTGEGVRKTLNIIQKEFPKLKIKKLKSGTKVFDWNIPEEWNVTDAYVIDKYNNRIIDFKKNRLSPDLVFYDDFENPKKVKNNSVDCILGMGAFYYAKNVNKTLLNQKKKLKKNGRLIFSLRNRLFDIVTLNNYTKKLLDEIYEVKKLKKEWKNKYKDLTKNFTDRKKLKSKTNIDEAGVFNHIPHNPLTISDEMAKLGLSVEGIYFYHFHAFPPVFDVYDKHYYRKISWKIENPIDWRGFFLASAFVVDCKKIF